jgi:hypothetical protein
MNAVSGVWRVLLRRAAGGASDPCTRWREVSFARFEHYLRAYPRPLELRPRITRKSGHREWMDTTLGSWPANAVAKAWTRGRNQGFQIRSVASVRTKITIPAMSSLSTLQR